MTFTVTQQGNSKTSVWTDSVRNAFRKQAGATAECELCRRIKESSEGGVQGAVTTESIGHIQSAGCAGQIEAVTAAHNKCIRDLMGDIQVHRKKQSNLTFLTMEEEHTISTLWEQDGCSEICSKEDLWQAAKSEEMRIPLLEEQDTVLRAYFAQKYDKTPTCGGGGCNAAGPKGLAHLSRDVYA